MTSVEISPSDSVADVNDAIVSVPAAVVDVKEYFEVIDEVQKKCRLCHTALKASGTSHLKRHLVRKHPVEASTIGPIPEFLLAEVKFIIS